MKNKNFRYTTNDIGKYCFSLHFIILKIIRDNTYYIWEY